MGKENTDKNKLNKASTDANMASDAKTKHKSDAFLTQGSEAGIERYARDKERATRQAIAKTPLVPVWIDPVTGNISNPNKIRAGATLNLPGYNNIRLTTSGTLTPKGNVNVDIFLVGGGGGGGSGGWSAGGGGGYTKTFKDIALTQATNYNVVVGAGGAVGGAGGVSTFASSYQAAGGSPGVPGAGGNGGSGGGAGSSTQGIGGSGGSDGANGTNGNGSGGIGQGTTTRAFGEAAGELFSGGGAGAGGTAGAGGGGGWQAAGTPNTGGGGSGAAQSGGSTGAAGGSGIVILRWKK